MYLAGQKLKCLKTRKYSIKNHLTLLENNVIMTLIKYKGGVIMAKWSELASWTEGRLINNGNKLLVGDALRVYDINAIVNNILFLKRQSNI